MIRLSRKGWNNVLIFASLFMILIFNGVHNKLINKVSPEQSKNLLPVAEVVLSADFPNISVERVGRGWRSLPQSEYTDQQVSDVINQWQQLAGDLVTNEVLLEQLKQSYPNKVVSFWFANYESAYVLQIFQHTDGLTYIKSPDAWYLTDAISSEFFL